MNIDELKSKIVEANRAYRIGQQIMSDAQFDALVESLQKELPEDEFSSFRDSLNDNCLAYGTKIKHRYVMGSLDKIKNSDPESLSKFINRHVKHKLNVSAKVDGISSVARYVDGRLMSFASRGDGYEGMSFFDKAKFIKNLPQTISFKDELFVRGELVILNSEEVDSDTNLRNVCAGWMNSKIWSKDDVSKISFVPYTILGDKFTKDEQFNLLEKLGFSAAWHIDIDPYQENLSDVLTEYAHKEHAYSCDGLVLIDNEAYNEQDIYRPKNSFAFKINELNGITKIVDVSWEGPSKNGVFCPIAIVDPIELGGSIISKCTLHNIDFMDKLNIDYGDTVEIIKSGDIIPKIIRIISKRNM